MKFVAATASTIIDVQTCLHITESPADTLPKPFKVGDPIYIEILNPNQRFTAAITATNGFAVEIDVGGQKWEMTPAGPHEFPSAIKSSPLLRSSDWVIRKQI